MHKILLLYASLEGQTAKIAGRLRELLEEEGAQVTLASLADNQAMASVDPAAFDKLVFGASIHVGKIEPVMTAYINRHSAVIGKKPRSLFIVLLSAATADAERREQTLAEVRRNVTGHLHVPFADVEMIAGALKYTQYNWFIRWIMQGIAKKEGGSTDTSRDHEYTDWRQVAAYAQRLSIK